MPRLAVVVTPLLVWSLWTPASSLAESPQNVRSDSPAHISVVDGAASLERDGQSESAPASMPLLAGDRIRTQNGRVEILFDDGSTLHLDGNTLVDFQSDEVVRLLGGRVRLNILGAGAASRTVSYRVDAPSAWVQIARAGEYRISIIDGPEGRGDDVELAVLRGGAELVNEDGRTVLGAGERAFARARLASLPLLRFQLCGVGRFRSLVGSSPRQPARRVRRIPARERSNLRVDIQPVRVLAERANLWLRVVPASAVRLAAVLLRTLDNASPMGLDVDWQRSVGLADASLRTLGILGRRMVLDSRPHVGPGVGVMGLRARIRQLVPARLEQSRGLRIQRRHLRWTSIRRVERVDRRAAQRIRPRLRERQRRQPHAHRRAARAMRS